MSHQNDHIVTGQIFVRDYTRAASCILLGGPVNKIQVQGKVYLFEWSDYCGPMPCTQKSSGRDLPPRHPFWTAVSHWHEQGKKIDDAGFCLWRVPPPNPLKLKHLSGKHYLLVNEEENKK